MCIEAWMAKLKINIITIFSIYLKHSKKKLVHFGNSVAQVHCHNLRDIIQFKKKKRKEKKKKGKKIPLLQTLHYIILPAPTDHLQILGQ